MHAPTPPSLTDEASATLHVTSETDLLRQVIVHTPGREMELVSPENRLRLLFDDILYLGQAREEHLLMCRLFEKVVGRPDTVLEVSTLLREAFDEAAARDAFVDQLIEIERDANLQAFEQELKALDADTLHAFALTGESPLPLNASPLPNMLFTRDLAAVVDGHIVMSHAATSARSRESVIINVVLHHHPGFAHLHDRIIELPRGVTFEGGDLLVASERLALIGHSERTSFGGLMSVAQALFDRTSIEHVLMVNLPKARYCMHLDTVFTFASPTECVTFPSVIDAEGLGNVVLFSQGDSPGRLITEVQPSLKQALEHLLDRSLTFIPCGGGDPISQRREQWTDGANLFAVAPGVVVGYERNGHTFDALRRHGYRVASVKHFLSYYAESSFELGEKVALKLEGTELSRGRGGPRCMTLPLARRAKDDD